MTPRTYAYRFADLYYSVCWLIMTDSDPKARLRQIDPALMQTIIRNAFMPRRAKSTVAERSALQGVTSQVDALFQSTRPLTEHLRLKSTWFSEVETWLNSEGRALIQDSIRSSTVSNLPTRITLSTLLPPAYKPLIEILPEIPEDVIDAFIFAKLRSLASANRGCGLPAIQAEMKLRAMSQMSLKQLREVARNSPDFSSFADAHSGAFSA